MIFSGDELAADRELKRIAAELKADFNGGEINLLRNEINFVLYLYPPAKASGEGTYVVAPAFFQIKASILHPYSSFHVRKNDTFDWITEHIFFKHDFQTRDAEFDSQFFLKVADEGWGIRFFSNKGIRSCLSSILLSGFHRIYSEDSDIKTDWFIKSLDDIPSSEIIDNALKNLGCLIQYE